MVTREEAKEKWKKNFERRISKMADKMGDEDQFLQGVANYLGTDLETLQNDDDASAVAEDFSTGSDLTQSEIEDLIVAGVPGVDNLSDALDELADDWDEGYASAFGQ